MDVSTGSRGWRLGYVQDASVKAHPTYRSSVCWNASLRSQVSLVCYFSILWHIISMKSDFYHPELIINQEEIRISFSTDTNDIFSFPHLRRKD